jgi:transcriptional regulator with XRE-family HTH domain
MAGPVDAGAERIGARIRATRRARGLTLVQLAGLSDLSHSFLSQLERGHARPSMGSLERVARALGTSQVELLTAGAQPLPHRVVRAADGQRGGYGSGEARVLAGGFGAPFQTMEVTGRDTEFGHTYVHVEYEWVYVVAGRVEVALDGIVSLLEPGDSVACPPRTAHHWRSPDGGPYVLVVVKEQLQQS